MSERMNERKNEWMNEWTDGQTNERFIDFIPYIRFTNSSDEFEIGQDSDRN